MAPIIEVERLSKRYAIGRLRKTSRSLRESIGETTSALISRLLRRTRDDDASPSEIWALKDISFNLAQGEDIGSVGHNGAGKSTLLKILARITEPSAGRAVLWGRTASLLEVGTGFHPDLTGRENVFLNGAILGMGRHEIQRKFDEIVAFAEVEQFVDTPVKHYSSGMYMRLPFGVGSPLEPETLIAYACPPVGAIPCTRKPLANSQRAVLSEGQHFVDD